MTDSVYRLLGLCMKAGRLLSGNEQVADGLKKGKGRLLLIAGDAAPQTRMRYEVLAKTKNTPFMIFGEKERLGQALGKSVRTAVLITDRGFSEEIQEKLKTKNKETEAVYAKI